jgi:hypothetical protein
MLAVTGSLRVFLGESGPLLWRRIGEEVSE